MPTRKYLKNRNTRKLVKKRKQTYKKFKGGATNEVDIKQQLLNGLDSMSEKELSANDRERIKKIINGDNFNKKLNSIMDKINQNLKNNMNSKTKEQINKMILELFFQPDTSKLYSKEGSPANDMYETGEIVVRIRNKDANWLEHLKKKTRSVDMLLANILNKCNDWACLTNNDPPLIAKEVITISDNRKQNI